MSESAGKIMLVTVLVVLVSAIIAYTAYVAVKPPEMPQTKYGLWEFKNTDGFWHTTWQQGKQLYDLAFKYHPKEVENVIITGTQPSENFSTRQEMHLTFDLNTSQEKNKYLTLAAVELNFNLQQVMGKNTKSGCIAKTQGCENATIIDCTENISVIRVMLKNETTINTTTPDCITLTGQNEEIIKAVERMFYTWYGIMR